MVERILLPALCLHRDTLRPVSPSDLPCSGSPRRKIFVHGHVCSRLCLKRRYPRPIMYLAFHITLRLWSNAILADGTGFIYTLTLIQWNENGYIVVNETAEGTSTLRFWKDQEMLQLTIWCLRVQLVEGLKLAKISSRSKLTQIMCQQLSGHMERLELNLRQEYLPE